jgi:aminopeptidase N
VFDQPNLKVFTFTSGLTVPPGWQAMANAPVRDLFSSGAAKQCTFAT